MLILNGQVLEPGAPEVSLLNRSFKYGDSLFETIRVYEGKPLFMTHHLERLTDGMKVLRFAFEPERFAQHITLEVQRIIDTNQVLAHGSVRLQVFRSGGGTYRPLQHEPYYLLEAHSLKDDPFKFTSSVALVAYRDASLHFDALSRFKTGNALPYVLAAIYAWVLLGEAVGPVQMLGGLVVLGGIYLARRGS